MAQTHNSSTPGLLGTISYEEETGFAQMTKAGVPTNGTSGDGAGVATTGSMLYDTTNNASYTNVGTKASPNWKQDAYLFKLGVPTNGTSGDGAGVAEPGMLLFDVNDKVWFTNVGTKASPNWQGGTIPLAKLGAPAGGAGGDGAGAVDKGGLCQDFTNGYLYINTGTRASPTWTKVGTQS